MSLCVRLERSEADVLRMLRDDRGARRVLLILEGRIVTEWADALEEECLALIRSGFRVAIDLSGVVFIDRRGVDALDRLGRAGIEIKGCSPLVADILEEKRIRVIRKSEEMNDRIVPSKRRCFEA
jgi:anti-anti-sigma regulatory factor